MKPRTNPLIDEARNELKRLLKPDTNFTSEEIEDALEQSAKGVVPMNLTKAEKMFGELCNNCGACCRTCNPIVLSDEDVYVLREVLGIFFSIYVIREDNKWWFSKTAPCAFLNENNTCRIYNYRPTICRQYPVAVNKEGNIGITVGVTDGKTICCIPAKMIAYMAISQLIIKRNQNS